MILPLTSSNMRARLASSDLPLQLLLLTLMSACHVFSKVPQAAALGEVGPNSLNAALASDSSWTATLRPFFRQHVIRPFRRPFSKRLNKRSMQCVLGSSVVSTDEDEDEQTTDEEDDIWERPPASVSSDDEEPTDEGTASSSSPSATSRGSEAPVARGPFSLRKTYQGESFFEDWDL